ncbi:phosphoenolpyruvate synthase [Clostridium sp. FP1]|uniref:phosphoenolpyruvate synthase n=1 Tax=Clostridium sp. FP1 TaxID=2724076 RepID=UPI0013E97AB7|nr:phosphoenolpyruvate synthase [Clostridium sp. FP1]MBZ9634689.1 phosphoenolpyruvate synthase [Clostridium sp. FP1]
MSSYLLSFKDIDKSKLEVVGGKGANLGELSRIEGLQVPEGFCVTTAAYKKVIEYNKEFNRLLEELSHLKVDDRKKIGVICGKIRSLIEGITIPKDIDEGITAFIKKFGEKNAYAVRSSATAEDLPLASFAGQQDTYLNIIGKDDILHHVSKCWASLFTDRAVIYRIQNNFDHRRVYLSVVIQKMVFPVASGIMFTADPISGNRKVTSIDASFGLGEALVSGLVNADIYKAKAGKIIDKKISTKKVAIYGIPKGGTEQREIDAAQQNDPSIPEYFMSRSRAMMSELEQQSQKISGNELFDFVEKSMARIKDNMMDTYGVVFSGAYATSWINKKLEKWLGEKNLADTLAQSVSNNVTSEMGLELLDVSDVVRKYPEVIKYLEHPKDETFFEDLVKLPGGIEARDAIREFLKKYGMRCSAEIDISRTRWNERPTILVPLILGNIKVYPPNAHEAKFEQGLKEAKEKEQDILSRLQKLSGGRVKAKKAKRAISVLRNYAGYREFNKYTLIWYEWVIKQVIMKEAERLVLQGIIKEPGDIFYLEYEELREVIKTNKLDYSIIQKRKEDYEIYEKLTPPRVITSDGEIISSQYDISKIPEGALAGVPVSAGIIEGRARIILRIEDANIEEGDILVTTFTDPSWTPVFVSIKGLITEVGGMMTHGAVVAREYGLPAVVSVENATKLIKDGQRIQVNGTEGYVEILH